MELTFLDVFIAVLSMLILMLPGFILGKCKLLHEKASDTCSTIVLYVCQAALMFNCFQKAVFTPRIGWNMLIVLGITLLVHVIMILIILLCVKADATARLRVMRFASVFTNCGFMGIPFLQMLFSENPALNEMLIYAAVINAVFNVLTWTVGAVIMTGDKKQISIKKIFTNPTLIAVALGVIVFVIAKKPLVDLCVEGSTGDTFITKIMSSVGMISDMVTPLSMFVIGLRLSAVKLKALLLDKQAYFVTLNKLVVMPIIVMASVLFLPVANEIKFTVFLLLSMPSASSTVLFAVKFNGDSDFASLVVLQSTLLAIVAIPLMFLVFNAFIGVV